MYKEKSINRLENTFSIRNFIESDKILLLYINFSENK